MILKIHPKKFILLMLSAITIFLYMIVIGFRDSSIGSDSSSYRYSFEANTSKTFEAGFNLLIQLVKYFSSDYHLFFTFTALLTGLLFFVAGVKLFGSRYIIFYIFVLTTFPFFYSISSNIIRQGLALGVVLFGYSVFQELKTKFNYWLLLVIILSATIHLPTAAIMLPLVINYKMNRVLYTWFGLVFLSIFSNYYAPLVTSFVSGRFLAYVSDGHIINYTTGFRWQFVVFSAMPILLLILTKHKNMSNAYRKMFDVYFVINGIGMLFNFLPYFDRFLLPSWILMPFIYTYSIVAINSTKIDFRNKIIICIIIFLSVIVSSFFVFWIGIH